MSEFRKIMSSIENEEYSPFYLLHGDEPYFIDKIESKITDNLIDDSSRSFDYSLFYGKDVNATHIVETAKRFPMLSSHNLIVVREAQNLDKSMDIIADYLSSPQVKTVLVICYKYKKIDKRTKLYKAAKKIGVILESNPLYDNKLSPWILGKLKDYGLNTDNHGLQLLSEALGNDLNKIEKQIEKLKVSMGDLTNITPDLIEEYVGFSKDFNNFELYRALGGRDFKKCCQIVKYMSENPKNHPLILTISGFYTFFRRLLTYHGISDKSNAAKILGINPFFLRDYHNASLHFNLKQSSKAINLAMEADLKSKGVGAKSINHRGILQELLVKVFTI